MGTNSVIMVRQRKAKKNHLSKLGGPTESQYYYQYFVCIWRRFDGYVIGGVGKWLTNFLCKIICDCSLNSSKYVDASILAAELVRDSFSLSEHQPYVYIMPIDSLKQMFKVDYEYVYIITYEEFSDLAKTIKFL